MLRGAVAVMFVLAALASAGVVGATGNEAPLAAAGLDQQVSEGSMVYLDAGGSLDPDGNVTDYSWEITAPNGTTRSPVCPSCAQTRFRATQNGTYTVMVTVTDDDGATQSDTLYVNATAVDPPAVSLTGPTEAENGTTASFEASITAGDTELETLVWTVNGTTVTRQSLTGTDAERTLTHTLSATGERTLRARALDRAGRSDSSAHVFSATPNSSNDGSSSDPSGNSEMGGRYSPLDRLGNSNDAYYLRLNDGEVRAGDNNEIVFNQEQIEQLRTAEGVELGETYINTGETEALVITNPRIKSNIDKDAGQLGTGFQGDELTYTSKSGQGTDYKPKWRQTSPGYRWDKVDRKKLKTATSPTRVDKPGWELTGTVTTATSDTYAAHNKRRSIDQRVGTRTETSTTWKDSPTGGEVVQTRRNLEYYTWDEMSRETKRVKVGERVVGYDVTRGYRRVPHTETETKCLAYSPGWFGERQCISERTITKTTYEWEHTVIDREPIMEPVYETRIYTTTSSARGSDPPWHAVNVEAHYDTDYKVQTTEKIPVWQEHEKEYKYNIYKYKWIRN